MIEKRLKQASFFKILLPCVAIYSEKYISLHSKCTCPRKMTCPTRMHRSYKNRTKLLKMKKVQDASIGGRNFFLDEDAYERLGEYLGHFRARLNANSPKMAPEQIDEVMNDLESRIAELFMKETGSTNRTVNIGLVNRVTSQLGMPDGSQESETAYGTGPEISGNMPPFGEPHKKIYRSMDYKVIGGICSGLAIYFGVDVVLVRLLAIIALIAGTAGFWVYVIFWIVIPKAETPVQKCEMHGLPLTAENLARFNIKRK